MVSPCLRDSAGGYPVGNRGWRKCGVGTGTACCRCRWTANFDAAADATGVLRKLDAGQAKATAAAEGDGLPGRKYGCPPKYSRLLRRSVCRSFWPAGATSDNLWLWPSTATAAAGAADYTAGQQSDARGGHWLRRLERRWNRPICRT